MDIVQGGGAFISSIVSWKVLALILALINIKNIPLSWHLRLLYAFLGNMRFKLDSPVFPPGTPLIDSNGRPTHPIFVPYGTTTRTPFLESDYNLHKSNSTYFSDLDVARTTLVVRLYTPGIYIASKEVDRELLAAKQAGDDKGKATNMNKYVNVAVGSVYCAFKREVKPFELYQVQSKIIAWDQKWLYIMSFFLRPAAKKGMKQTLLAAALTKYVVKKGRLTISPARVLRANGLLPPLPEGMSDESLSVEQFDDDDERVRNVVSLNADEIPDISPELAERVKANAELGSSWTYGMIEQERRRGLQVVAGYANLDARVFAEWEG